MRRIFKHPRITVGCILAILTISQFFAVHYLKNQFYTWQDTKKLVISNIIGVIVLFVDWLVRKTRKIIQKNGTKTKIAIAQKIGCKKFWLFCTHSLYQLQSFVFRYSFLLRSSEF